MKVVIIGGGPAGIMAAIKASENKSNEVILIEKMDSLGRKLLITGKGRCNITNNIDVSEFIENIPCNGNFMYSALYTFSNINLIEFLNKLGLDTKVERGQRVFPVSDKSIDVLRTLQKALAERNVRIVRNEKVNDIIVNENNEVQFVVTDKQKLRCNKVILATGGKSYSATGSTGDGYRIAEKLGHSIVKLKPSLVPIETDEIYDIQGLSLKNVGIKIIDKSAKKKIYEDFGEMIFTHFGVSGPIILSSSSYAIRYTNIEEKIKNKEIVLEIDLKPALDDEKLRLRIKRDFDKFKNKQFCNSLNELLPKKLIQVILELSNIPKDKKVCDISNIEINNLAQVLKHFTFTLKGFRPIEEAIITSGGVNVKEINPSTMQSKLVSGLYFAGEIIDVDAYTGGFNLQIAFSTGYLAGMLQS